MLLLALTLAAAASPDTAPALDDVVVDAVSSAALHSPWLAADEHKGSSSSSSSSSSSASFSPSNNSGTSFQDAGSASTPQGRKLGVGLQLGYPTSLTLKYMLTANQGIVAGIGGFSGYAYNVAAFSLHVDYVYHPMLLTQGDAYQVTWYVGGGGELLVFNNPHQLPFFPVAKYSYAPTNVWISARVPLGINLALTQIPFEIYLEASPSLLLFPGVTFGIGAAIGGRFYF